jgi:hypothetical protein
VKKAYRTIRKEGKVNEQELTRFLVKNGQGLLPMVDLIEQCQMACNELIDVTGRAAIQAVLQLSAMEAAGGPPQQGKRRSGGVVFYGRQSGQVFLSDRKLEVTRPRLRSKAPRSQEMEVPAYSAMQNQERMGARMLDILLHGVSTRNYKAVIPAMAETAGVSKSAVSRQMVQASEAEVEALLNRRFDELKLLVIYIDGLIFGDYTMIGGVGVDVEGNKHVLGIREGATENSTVITALLEDIVARGVDPQRKMLFVIDGSKAAANRHQRRLRRPPAGTALPRPQAAQRARLPAQRRPAASQKRAPCGLETPAQGRHGTHQETGRMAGSEVPFGGR